MTSRMITMVGQWALVKDQMDDACAVCGTVFAVAGWVCATVGVDGVVAGAVRGRSLDRCGRRGYRHRRTASGGVTATGEDAGAVAGAEAVVAARLRSVFAIATSVLPMPLSVAATAASCEGVSVVFAAIEAFNWVSVAASVFKVA